MIVNIDVPDLRSAVAFYTAGIEFTFRRYLFGGSVAELEREGVLVHLIEVEAPRSAFPGGPVRSYSRHWTAVHIDLVVDELDAGVDRAMAAWCAGER